MTWILSARMDLCRNIQREKDEAEKAAQAVIAKAKAMAIALQTIGKFVIKKKVGESDQIYGRSAYTSFKI